MHPHSIRRLFVPVLMGLNTARAGTVQGFNYDAVNQTQATFEADFNLAKQLTGTEGNFTSARLFTMIQDKTANDPILAIPAAINTNTSLLLGLWYVAGKTQNETTALRRAIDMYGKPFTDLVVGISAGSEDLYRSSPIGIANNAGVGATPDELVHFINDIRANLTGTALASTPIGHVDTWQTFTDAANSPVIDAVDFLGVDAYPYWQSQPEYNNVIDNAGTLFSQGLGAVVAASKGKKVWVTETGWPITGNKSGQAIVGPVNAARYWQDVGCKQLFQKINTWWFALHHNDAVSFRVTDGNADGLYGPNGFACAA